MLRVLIFDDALICKLGFTGDSAKLDSLLGEWLALLPRLDRYGSVMYRIDLSVSCD